MSPAFTQPRPQRPFRYFVSRSFVVIFSKTFFSPVFPNFLEPPCRLLLASHVPVPGTGSEMCALNKWSRGKKWPMWPENCMWASARLSVRWKAIRTYIACLYSPNRYDRLRLNVRKPILDLNSIQMYIRYCEHHLKICILTVPFIQVFKLSSFQNFDLWYGIWCLATGWSLYKSSIYLSRYLKRWITHVEVKADQF